MARRRDADESTSRRTRCPTRQSRSDTKTTMAKAKAEPELELELRRPELERRAKTAERRRDELDDEATRRVYAHAESEAER